MSDEEEDNKDEDEDEATSVEGGKRSKLENGMSCSSHFSSSVLIAKDVLFLS